METPQTALWQNTQQTVFGEDCRAYFVLFLLCVCVCVCKYYGCMCVCVCVNTMGVCVWYNSGKFKNADSESSLRQKSRMYFKYLNVTFEFLLLNFWKCTWFRVEILWGTHYNSFTLWFYTKLDKVKTIKCQVYLLLEWRCTSVRVFHISTHAQPFKTILCTVINFLKEQYFEVGYIMFLKVKWHLLKTPV